jgi:two-component system chemotaxis response regulator CheY
MKVLLADDSGTMRKIQTRCLNQMGIDDITDAADGVEALAAFEADRFDVVITDWNMPNMDGLELLKAIRTRNTKIPVIMVTTEAERARVMTAIQAGVTDYLVKPFSPEDLRAKFEKHVTVPI